MCVSPSHYISLVPITSPSCFSVLPSRLFTSSSQLVVANPMCRPSRAVVLLGRLSKYEHQRTRSCCNALRWRRTMSFPCEGEDRMGGTVIHPYLKNITATATNARSHSDVALDEGGLDQHPSGTPRYQSEHRIGSYTVMCGGGGCRQFSLWIRGRSGQRIPVCVVAVCYIDLWVK